jgi:DNA helicase-2/ATP-dependent DNA helicase PcrA
VDPTRLLFGLDRQQREAVTTTAAPLAIVAAAGSGKTTVLTRRIAHRLADGSAEAQHVVALTFTRDAAGELKRRLRKLDIREPIEAGTFHSVALRLLRDRAFTRHETIPNIASDRVRLVRECIAELRLKVEPFAALADIDWARARLVPVDRYEAAVRSERRRSAVPPSAYAGLVAAYEKTKRRRGVIDFDDLLSNSLHAARNDPAFADLVRWRFRHFFVDEAQDLNPLQHALLESWRSGRPDLCLVGDPRQAIYGWNGADHTTLTEVERRYPGVTVVSLTTNYRCSPQVVRAGAAALEVSGQRDDTVSDQPDGPAISVREFANDIDEAAGVALQVRAALNHGAGGDIAVLARTNDQLNELQRALTALGIPTERAAGRSPLDLALAEAHRSTTREQLAGWAEAAFAEADPIRRRVAEEIDRFLSSNEPGGFRVWIENRAPFDDLVQPDSRESVAVLTFHGAKGREWRTVFVTGVEEGLVPHSGAISSLQRAEEARLLYVAVTRAAHDLTLTWAHVRHKEPATRSAWLDQVEASAAADAAVGPPAAVSRPVARPAVDPLVAMRQWRTGIARVAGVDDQAVCSDRTLQALLDDPPTDTADVARRLGVSESAAGRLRPLPSMASR